MSSATEARLWPGEDAIGKCLVLRGSEDSCSIVVGVATGHAGTTFSLDAQRATETALLAWTPLVADGSRSPSALLVRPRGRAAAATESIRRAVLEAPEVRYVEIAPLTDYVGLQLRSWRLGATLFTLFAVLGVCVAGVGLYGVLAYDVALRRREIGIRLALGARPRRILLRVLLGAVGTVLVGLAAALPLAVWGAARLHSLMFEVSPRDPTVFLLAAAILLATGIVAAALPAWSATRVQPREALEG